jgi:hypothetical protein
MLRTVQWLAHHSAPNLLGMGILAAPAVCHHD